MEYEKLTHTKRQHTIPRCYLKNFSDDGSRIYKKEKRKHTTISDLEKELNSHTYLKAATVVEDVYTVKNGSEPMLIETLIYAREIEDRYLKIYDLLVNPATEGFNMDERVWILTCLLSMHCRTPKQFRLFEKTIPSEYLYERDKIMEDYKAAHVSEILPRVIEAHQFKRVIIAKISDSSEFITSDNPVLIIGRDNSLKSNIYTEQFNMDNIIFIPLDRKHCFILTHALDKYGVNAQGKAFYNKIERIHVDCSFVQNVNWKMIENADSYCYGPEIHMKAFFSLYLLVDNTEEF